MEKVRQRLAEPPRPSSLSPWIAPPLDELVASLLDLDRESRPASAAQVAAELRRILDSEDETLQLPSKESEGTEAGSGGRLRRLVQRARDLFGE
jgi:hypothetical protein